MPHRIIVKLVHWPFMGGLLHLVQRWGDWVGPQPAQALLAVPNVTAYSSTASVPITALLCVGPLLCVFNVPVKGSGAQTLISIDSLSKMDPVVSQTPKTSQSRQVLVLIVIASWPAVISTVRGWSEVTGRHHDALTPVTTPSSGAGVLATVDRHHVERPARAYTEAQTQLKFGALLC